MELKAGYKQTEVGVIPEDWETYSLRDVCDFENGDRGVNYPSGSDFVASGVPFVNAGHLERGKIKTDRLDYIAPAKFDTLGSGKFKKNDVLFCLRGSLGKFAVVGSEISEGAVASSLIIIRPRPKALLLQYFTSYLDSKICTDMIELWAGGAAQPNLGGRELARFSIPLPPTLSEQRALSTALSDADALINSLDALIAKKRDLKQAAMQQLLTGRTRLPGFTGDWEVKRLGEVLKVRHGKSQKGVEAADGAYPILATGGEIGRTDVSLYGKPSVLIGRKGTIDSPQFIDTPFWTIDTLFFTEISAAATPKFIFYKFLLIDWRTYNEASGVPSLSSSTIEKIEFACPKLDEQTAIAEVLSDMDAELAALEAQREKAHALKQGMMQELLTGRIRLV